MRRSCLADPRPAAPHNHPPAPISSGSESPRHHRQSTISTSCARSLQRQQHTKSRPFSLFAFDFDPAPMGIDDHLEVKHANAKTFFLGRLKRLEEGAADEVGAHPAAVVV